MTGYFHYEPRPITDRAFWDNVKNDPRLAGLTEAVRSVVETLPARPPMPLASDFMAADWTNDRQRTDVHWQVHRRQLSYLILDRLLKGIDPNDRDERLLDWIWSFTNEATWTVSAHVPGRIADLRSGILDLASTEMAALLAEAVEVLKPWMDSISPQLAPSILFEIDRRILTPFLGEFQSYGWADPKNPHISNWTGVCAGSVLAACRAMANLGHPRPQQEKRAIDLLKLYWQRGFTPEGECDEGIMYWIYGVAFACYGMSRLSEAEFRQQFDLERVRQVASYPRRAHLTGTLFFSGNDSHMSASQPVFLTPWLAAATGESWLLQWPINPTSPDRKGDAGQAHFRHIGTILRAATTPAGSVEAPSAPAAAPASLLKDQQAAIVRTETAAGPLIACLSGGNNGERHNHNDVGQFLLVLDGKQRIIDLGAPNYVNDFFGPKRYTYMPARSRGHNVPVIDGQEQFAGAEAAAKILAWDATPGSASLAIDATAAYPKEAKLKSWTRMLRQRGDHRVPFALQDQYVTSEPGISIGHAWWSIDRPEFLAADRIKMGRLVFHLPRPMAINAEEYTAASLNLREFGGQTLYRIEATYETDGQGKLSVQTLIAVE